MLVLLPALFATGAVPRNVLATEPETILLASTTSVENSGLLAHILPEFTRATGITVHVVAQGTGQALATAAHGDADLLLVHDPEAEAFGKAVHPQKVFDAIKQNLGNEN